MYFYGKCVQIKMSVWLNILSSLPYKTVALGQEMTKLHIFEVMNFSTFNLNYLKTNFCGHSTNQYISEDAVPDYGGNLMTEALLNWEAHTPPIIASSRRQKTIQRLQSDNSDEECED